MGSLSLGLPKLAPQTESKRRPLFQAHSAPAGRRRLLVEAFGGGDVPNEPVVIFVCRVTYPGIGCGI